MPPHPHWHRGISLQMNIPQLTVINAAHRRMITLASFDPYFGMSSQPLEYYMYGNLLGRVDIDLLNVGSNHQNRSTVIQYISLRELILSDRRGNLHLSAPAAPMTASLPWVPEIKTSLSLVKTAENRLTQIRFSSRHGNAIFILAAFLWEMALGFSMERADCLVPINVSSGPHLWVHSSGWRARDSGKTSVLHMFCVAPTSRKPPGQSRRLG